MGDDLDMEIPDCMSTSPEKHSSVSRHDLLELQESMGPASSDNLGIPQWQYEEDLANERRQLAELEAEMERLRQDLKVRRPACRDSKEQWVKSALHDVRK